MFNLARVCRAASVLPVAAVVGVLPPGLAAADNVNTVTPFVVEYDHFKQNGDLIVHRNVPEWGGFRVKVVHSCDAFEAVAAPLPRELEITSKGGLMPEPAAIARLVEAVCVISEEALLDHDFVHDPAFGGYIVDIRSRQGGTAGTKRAIRFLVEEKAITKDDVAAVEKWKNDKGSLEDLNKAMAGKLEVKDLKDTRLIIALTRSWNIELAGGFTVSSLTNPEFAVAGTPATVRREEDNEDEVSLGLAAFVHTSHAAHPRHALTMGLGLGEISTLSLHLGYSWRLGGKTFLTWGGNVAKVDALPNGVREGDVVTDPNVLNNLQKRYDVGFFMGISYSFLGSSAAALQKPFQTASGTTTPGGS